MHLPLIGRGTVTHVPTEMGVVGLLTRREELLESIQARESVALAGLGAATGGQSLCGLSRGAAPPPTVKYHEGAAAALAEARRVVRAVAEGPGAADAVRSVLLDVRARWLEQSRSTGRTGPSWTSYLAGGLDALEQLVGADRGSGMHDGTN